MALPIIRDTTVGGEIGQSLGSGLQELANLKLQDVQRRQHLADQFLQRQLQQGQTKQALKRLNLPEEYALLDPSSLNQIIKTKLGGPSIGQALNAWFTGVPYGGGALENQNAQAQAQQNQQDFGPISQQEQVRQQERGGPESWGEYIQRNLAKTPTLAYEAARSGLGLGNLAELLYRKTGISPYSLALGPIPDLLSKTDKGRELLGQLHKLTTTEQANKEASAVLPRYMTEHRPEDRPAEAILNALPFLASAIGTGGASAILPAIGAQAGILGGGEIGERLGGRIGRSLGDEEVGQVLGGLAGGLGGGALAHGIVNRPSKTLPGQVAAQELGAFEEAKAGKLKSLEKEYAPQLRKQKEALQKSNLEPAKQKSQFEQAKKESINQVKSDIAKYDDVIKTLEKDRKPLYNEARKLESKTPGDASGVIKTMNEVYDNLGKGFSPSETELLRKNLQDLERHTAKGTLTTHDAKIFKENFNNQLYNKNVSPGYKKQLVDLNKELNKFIEKNSSPEHNQAYKQAEKLHKDYSELKKNRDDFISNKEQDIREIKKEKIAPEKIVELAEQKREAQRSLKELEKEHKEAVNAVGKERFEDFVKDQKAQGKTINTLETAVNSGLFNNVGKSTLAGALGYVFGGKFGAGAALISALGKTAIQEARLAREVFQKYPAIRDQAIKTLINAHKYTPVQVATSMNRIGKHMQQKEKNIPNT